jgi:hypothetical protein
VAQEKKEEQPEDHEAQSIVPHCLSHDCSSGYGASCMPTLECYGVSVHTN